MEENVTFGDERYVIYFQVRAPVIRTSTYTRAARGSSKNDIFKNLASRPLSVEEAEI